MLHLTIFLSPANSALEAECNEIASLLKGPDVDVRVYEAPVTHRPDSDFALVFADDLSSHHELLRSQPGARVEKGSLQRDQLVGRPPRDG